MRTDNTFLKLILMLCLLGILVSGWLLSIHVKFSTGQAALTESCSLLPMSGGSQGCATVAVSDYSDVFGIPLAAIAMGYYFSLLLLVFWAMRNYQAAYEALYVSFFLATLAIPVTVLMFAISRFALQSFCTGCAILWLVNLSIWPCLVKHLNLRWGTALAANLELLRPQNLNLQRKRVMNSFAVAALLSLIFSVVGAASVGLGKQQTPPGMPGFLDEFKNAPQVFLPPEAFGGPQAKGVANAENAVLDIVEFSDFQCPACRMAAQLLRPLLLKHKDKVRFSYRHFPLDGSCNPHAPNGRHGWACATARASICAANQNKFWEFHDLIFDHQDELSASRIDSLAKEAGLDMEKMASCLKDPSTESQLQKEMQWGELIGLESTPTLIINGRRFAGARPHSDLEALMQQIEREKKR